MLDTLAQRLWLLTRIPSRDYAVNYVDNSDATIISKRLYLSS